MNPAEFDLQMDRVRSCFGRKNYDPGRIEMIWKATADLSVTQMASIVEVFVSTARLAPLPKDFVDAANAARKKALDKDVEGAIKAKDIPWAGGLQKFLAKEYPGCKTLNQAVEVQIMRNKIARAMEEK